MLEIRTTNVYIKPWKIDWRKKNRKASTGNWSTISFCNDSLYAAVWPQFTNRNNSKNKEKEGAKSANTKPRPRSSPFAIKLKHQASTKLATFSRRADGYKLGDPNPSHGNKCLKYHKKLAIVEKLVDSGESETAFAGGKSCFPTERGGFPTKRMREKQ